MLAKDGEAVVHHAEGQKQHLRQLHEGVNGQNHVGVQPHVAEEETIAHAGSQGIPNPDLKLLLNINKIYHMRAMHRRPAKGA